MSTDRSRKQGKEKCLMDRHGKHDPDKKQAKSMYRKMGVPYPIWKADGTLREN